MIIKLLPRFKGIARHFDFELGGDEARGRDYAALTINRFVLVRICESWLNNIQGGYEVVSNRT